jgi:hypothetical protein
MTMGCHECGGPIQHGDILCDCCWDAVIAEGYERRDDGPELTEQPSGLQFPDECPDSAA